MNYAEAVAKGIQLLDEKVPGWHERIDLRDFDMSSGARCVLGQIYGTYEKGLCELELWVGISHGFSSNRFVAMPTLTHLWTEEINKRREEIAV